MGSLALSNDNSECGIGVLRRIRADKLFLPLMYGKYRYKYDKDVIKNV